MKTCKTSRETSTSVEYGSPELHYTADEGGDPTRTIPRTRNNSIFNQNRWKEKDGLWRKEAEEATHHRPWDWTDEDPGRDEVKVQKMVEKRIKDALAEKQAEDACRWTAMQCEVSKDRYEIQAAKDREEGTRTAINDLKDEHMYMRTKLDEMSKAMSGILMELAALRQGSTATPPSAAAACSTANRADSEEDK